MQYLRFMTFPVNSIHDNRKIYSVKKQLFNEYKAIQMPERKKMGPADQTSCIFQTSEPNFFRKHDFG